MTMQTLEDQIAERRRQAEVKRFREKAHAFTRGCYDIGRSVGSRRGWGHRGFVIETDLILVQGVLSSSTKIFYDQQLVFEEHDFTVTCYIPSDEWEGKFNFLLERQAEDRQYERSDDERDQLFPIDEEKIEATLRRAWGL